LGPTPKPAERCSALDRSFREIKRVASRYGGVRWDYRDVAESYGGSLRARYLEAERSLEVDGPLSSSDYLLRAFLKAEKLNASPSVVAKPRMIFPRTPRYNLVLASWLKPFEHWLWGNLRSVGLKGVPKSRVVAKGLNPRRRANLIRRKMRQIPECVVFEVDGKAFEAHVDRRQLELEHSVYAAAYPGDRDLMRVLSHQLENVGVTACGVKFGRSGGRASGDFNTGMGNSIIMLSIVQAVMTFIGLHRFDSLVDGDNALIFVPANDYERVVTNFSQLALRFSGHEMVLERPVRVVEEVRFGQSAPVETARGWTMVRDWRKVLSQGTSSHANLNSPTLAKRWLYGVSLCELSLARGVPIIGRWADSLRACTDQGSNVAYDLLRDYQAMGVDLSVVGKARYEPPSVRARESFSRAFGTSPLEQIIIEQELEVGRAVVELALPIEVSDSIEYREPELDAE
jgi:hypothetical protein